MPFRSWPRKPKARSQSELFSAPAERLPEDMVTAHVDGGARGNPGPAGYGVVFERGGSVVARLHQFVGMQTNNFAEYSGLLASLDYALAHQIHSLRVLSDSELMVRQIKGIYKVRSAPLQGLHRRAQELIRKLEWFRIEHVRREKNREADRLANLAMDE